MTISRLGCMYAGRIGFNWPNRAHARRCWLPGAVADGAGLTLVAAVERRGRIIRRRHDVNLTMTAFARWQFHAGHSPHAEFAVNADGLNLDDVAVTGAAVDRIEPAAVPPAIRADVAVEAFGRAMNGGLELSEVHFVAIVTGICLFFVARE